MNLFDDHTQHWALTYIRFRERRSEYTELLNIWKLVTEKLMRELRAGLVVEDSEQVDESVIAQRKDQTVLAFLRGILVMMESTEDEFTRTQSRMLDAYRDLHRAVAEADLEALEQKGFDNVVGEVRQVLALNKLLFESNRMMFGNIKTMTQESTELAARVEALMQRLRDHVVYAEGYCARIETGEEE